ncbi:MAG: dihydropteroate synthase [Gammaproteobacteria bacterium]
MNGAEPNLLQSPDGNARCLVMGILNVTPDSFSDGGRFESLPAAVDQAARIIEEGADLLDVGGESTRPGAVEVSVDQELERVIPVIEQLRARFEKPVSVDTSKPEVMRAAVAAGAAMINDVCALQAAEALDVAADLGVPVCLMHMQGRPRTMQRDPAYSDVTGEVREFLRRRMAACVGAGLAAEKLLVDPGFGFGKTVRHNLQLLGDLDKITDLGAPVVVGLSRKSMIGKLLDRPVGERLHASVALALLAAQRGAAVVRVHDVGPTVDALDIWRAASHGVAGGQGNRDGRI